MSTILIDAGGIIIDTRDLAVHKKNIIENYRQTYKINCSPNIFFQQFKKLEKNILKGTSLETVISDFFCSYDIILSPKQNKDIVKSYLAGYTLNKFYNGALTLLSSLVREGYRICIVSDAIEHGNELDITFSNMLKQYNIKGDYKSFYDKTITSADLRVMKKDGPSFFNKIIRLLNITKEDTLFIAHDLREINSALKAGRKPLYSQQLTETVKTYF